MTTQGSRLKELREVLRLSQAEFGSSLSIAGPSITKAEKNINKLSNDTLCKLAEIYNINLNWLLIGKGTMFVQEKAENYSEKFDELVKNQVLNVLLDYDLIDRVKE